MIFNKSGEGFSTYKQESFSYTQVIADLAPINKEMQKYARFLMMQPIDFSFIEENESSN
tara:strand:- start:185 stop:361 length:177 start_codon:yes stop_codon:yes gene_type:complete